MKDLAKWGAFLFAYFFTMSNYKEVTVQLQPPHDHSVPIVRFYWHSVMKHVLRMLEASKKDLILDFGCGKYQRLKNHLPEHNIIGYDVVREFSDKEMSPQFIITAQPMENLLARICNVFAKAPYSMNNFRLIDYKLKIDEIHEIFSDSFKLIGRKNVFTMTVVSKWTFR